VAITYAKDASAASAVVKKRLNLVVERLSRSSGCADTKQSRFGRKDRHKLRRLTSL